jgi:hypothetical protein
MGHRRFQDTMNEKIPQPIAAFIRAVNERDPDAFLSCFTDDAVVSDVGRQFRGAAAIKEWAKSEIFDVNVTLDVVNVASRDGEIVVTVKCDGIFDKTGLPDPLLLNHHFKLAGDKIAAFSSRLAGE